MCLGIAPAAKSFSSQLYWGEALPQGSCARRGAQAGRQVRSAPLAYELSCGCPLFATGTHVGVQADDVHARQVDRKVAALRHKVWFVLEVAANGGQAGGGASGRGTGGRRVCNSSSRAGAPAVAAVAESAA